MAILKIDWGACQSEVTHDMVQVNHNSDSLL
jgi:hypothetical protein